MATEDGPGGIYEALHHFRRVITTCRRACAYLLYCPVSAWPPCMWWGSSCAGPPPWPVSDGRWNTPI